MRRSLFVAALINAAFAQPALAQTTVSDSVLAARLAGLAHVWSAVRFLHPWTAYRDDLPIDSFAIAAIAQVRAARTPADFERAIAHFVEPLRDSITRIRSTRAPHPPNRWPTGTSDTGPSVEVLPDSTLVIGIHRYADVSDSVYGADVVLRLDNVPRARDRDLRNSGDGSLAGRDPMAIARAVVLDLRTDDLRTRTRDDVYYFRAAVQSLLRRMTTRRVTPPGQRNTLHVEFQREAAPNGDVSAASTTLLQPSARVTPDAGARDLPVVFVVNEHSELPLYAAGLIADGLAAIVSEGELGDAPYVDHRDVDAGEGVRVRVRTSEVVDSSGRAVGPATAVVSGWVGTAADPAMTRALALLREPWPRRSAAGVHRPPFVVQRAAAPSAGRLPSLDERIFAAVKFWGVITTFYPGIELRGKPWSEALAEFIPRMRDASTVTEYHLALARMTSRLEDSHATLMTPELQEWRGRASLPLRLDVVEGRVVVIEVAHDSLLRGALIRRGEVIRSIDEEDALARGRRIADTFSASTAARRDLAAGPAAGRGPLGSTARLVIENGDGMTRTVVVPRYAGPVIVADIRSRFAPPVRMVARDIGYIAPYRVHPDSADAAFDQLRDARAIILEWREGTGFTYPFVSQLVRVDSTPGTARRNFIGSLGGQYRQSDGSITLTGWCVCRNATRTYTGRAVLLIGPSAQSSMEVNAELAKKSGGAVFVGSPTSGTLGGTTGMYVPGGIALQFTSGNGPDRKGLQPDIPVERTIAGIRAGRDEVLEAAIAYLRKEPR